MSDNQVVEVVEMNENSPAFPCPRCGSEMDEYRNVGKSQFGVCHTCELTWTLGVNIFSSWRHEDMTKWEANDKYLDQFENHDLFLSGAN